jgi:hypothetical protein
MISHISWDCRSQLPKPLGESTRSSQHTPPHRPIPTTLRGLLSPRPRLASFSLARHTPRDHIHEVPITRITLRQVILGQRMTSVLLGTGRHFHPDFTVGRFESPVRAGAVAEVSAVGRCLCFRSIRTTATVGGEIGGRVDVCRVEPEVIGRGAGRGVLGVGRPVVASVAELVGCGFVRTFRVAVGRVLGCSVLDRGLVTRGIRRSGGFGGGGCF